MSLKLPFIPALVLPCLFAPALVRAADRPNILVIMSDEHNAAVTGCYGNAIVRTPNLDRLARQGITFDAAYTNSPLCVPCRLSFTAGKYISRVGAWNNDCELPSADYPSIAGAMTAAGYQSYLCGKMHYDRSRRYGFTEIGGDMNKTVKTGKGGRRDPDDLRPPEKRSARFDEFKADDTSSIIRHDQAVTAGTLAFLEHRKPTDKPFFLLAGYLAPHFPLIVPEKYWEHYKGKVPLPTIPPGYLDALPRNYKHLRVGFAMTDVDEATVRTGRELYYGLTEWVDEEIGKVLAALEASGLAENTVVIYTTDHGENMGEHGLWWKNCVFDTAARVPLIVSWPKRWPGGQRRVQACSLVDVVQTIAELGGAKLPADCDGDSLCAWMDDAGHAWKDIAVSEYYAHNISSGYAMIRHKDYKYVYHTPADEKHPAERELYDLRNDPGELVNLASKPGQQERIARMHEMLVKELGEDPDKTELRARRELQQGYNVTEPKRPRNRRAA